MRIIPCFAALAVFLAACGASTGEDTAETRAADHEPVLPFIVNNYADALAQAKERDLPIFVETWAPW